MAEFDIKQVSTYEWLGVGAGGAAFINSFLPWFSFGDGAFSVSVSGWNSGFLAFASVLMLIAVAVIILLPKFGVQVQQVTLIWLGLAAVAFLFTLLRWLTYPSGFGASPSIGVFIGLIIAAASAAGAFLTLKQTQPKAS